MKKGILVVICGLAFMSQTMAAHDLTEEQTDHLHEGHLIGNTGLELNVGITQVYQRNVKGGISTNEENGAYTGSYDIEIGGNLNKLLGTEGLSFYMLMEGSWPSEPGINDDAVGSYLGINDDAAGNRSLDITELWFEQTLLDQSLTIRAGKIDLTGGFECRACPVSFDGSLFANDETSQFLSSALINNPTIPFPDNGLALAIHYNPSEFWYISGAVSDAQADARETGFNTGFHGEDYVFAIAETGFTPFIDSDNGELQGAYRFGVWYDPQPKERFDNSQIERDDLGFYLTFDQLLCKEKNIEDDTQGLGAFFRYGWTDKKVEPELDNFVSFGLQYQGLFDGRDEDAIGIGWAYGRFSRDARNAGLFAQESENLTELYYNAKVNDHLSFSPHFQYIANPGATGDTSDAVVLGVRAQMTF